MNRNLPQFFWNFPPNNVVHYGSDAFNFYTNPVQIQLSSPRILRNHCLIDCWSPFHLQEFYSCKRQRQEVPVTGLPKGLGFFFWFCFCFWEILSIITFFPVQHFLMHALFILGRSFMPSCEFQLLWLILISFKALGHFSVGMKLVPLNKSFPMQLHEASLPQLWISK